MKFTYDPRPIMKQWPTQGPQEAKAASVEGSRESPPMQGVAAVATGSLPVSSAEVDRVATWHAGQAASHEQRKGLITPCPAEYKAHHERQAAVHRRCAEVLRKHAAEIDADEITAKMAAKCAQAGISFEEGVRRLAGLPTERQPEENAQEYQRRSLFA